MNGLQIQTHWRSHPHPRTVRNVSRPARKNRNVRVEDDLWDPSLRIAEIRQDVLAEVVRDKLAEYIADNIDLLSDEEIGKWSLKRLRRA